MVTSFQVDEQKNSLLILGVPAEKNNYKISFDKTVGKISRVTLFDGMEWHEIVAEEQTAGDNWILPVKMCEIAEKKDDYLIIIYGDLELQKCRYKNIIQCYPLTT